MNLLLEFSAFACACTSVVAHLKRRITEMSTSIQQDLEVFVVVVHYHHVLCTIPGLIILPPVIANNKLPAGPTCNLN